MTTPLYGRAWKIQVLTRVDNAGNQTLLEVSSNDEETSSLRVTFEVEQLPRLSSNCFGTGREHKLNLLCGFFGISDSKWMSGSARSRSHQPRGTRAQRPILIQIHSALSRARTRTPVLFC
jgi:hypothetical protein